MKSWAIPDGERWPFWLLVAFLILTVMIGGSSRADIASLVILRPVALLTCGLALVTLRREHIAEHKLLLGGLVAAVGLCVLHLVPLPYDVWSALPGRQIMVDIDAAAGLGQSARPLSMVPASTWNALFSLSVPAAVLLLGVQLPPRQLTHLLPIIIGLGLLTAVVGLIQALGPSRGPFYFYRITNYGAAVGLFANRNHQALFLASLLPMIASWASYQGHSQEKGRTRLAIAAAMAIYIVPLILVTGSRAGAVLAFVGLVLGYFCYRRPIGVATAERKTRRSYLSWLVGGVALIGGAMMGVVLSTTEAIERIISSDQMEDQRLLVWQPIIELCRAYFPFGSGIGSFVQAYQINEPDALLSTKYLNHAHNDLLEIVMTAGLPGLVLVVAALCVIAGRAAAAWRLPIRSQSPLSLVRLASGLVAMMVFSSLVDYPLRVPSITAIFSVVLLWLAGDTRHVRNGSQSDKRSSVAS